MKMAKRALDFVLVMFAVLAVGAGVFMAARAFAGTLVDQGAPGKFGPWPVDSAAAGGIANKFVGECGGTGALNITSTGTSATIATLTSGTIYSLSCDAAVHYRQGTTVTVSFTATPTTFGEKLASSPDKVRFVQTGVDFAIISVSGTANCVLLSCP
jgi:hypothetical protein